MAHCPVVRLGEKVVGMMYLGGVEGGSFLDCDVVVCLVLRFGCVEIHTLTIKRSCAFFLFFATVICSSEVHFLFVLLIC